MAVEGEGFVLSVAKALTTLDTVISSSSSFICIALLCQSSQPHPNFEFLYLSVPYLIQNPTKFLFLGEPRPKKKSFVSSWVQKTRQGG